MDDDDEVDTGGRVRVSRINMVDPVYASVWSNVGVAAACSAILSGVCFRLVWERMGKRSDSEQSFNDILDDDIASRRGASERTK